MKKFIVRILMFIPFLALLVVGDHGVATPVAYAFSTLLAIGMIVSTTVLILSPRVAAAALYTVRRPILQTIGSAITFALMFAAGQAIDSAVLSTLAVFYILFAGLGYSYLFRTKRWVKEEFGVDTDKEVRELAKQAVKEDARS